MATPQNCQTHSNNCLNVFDHFERLALKGLKCLLKPLKKGEQQQKLQNIPVWLLTLCMFVWMLLVRGLTNSITEE